MTRPIMPSDAARPEAIRSFRGGESGPAEVQEVQAVRPVDRIEISAEGRALSQEIKSGPAELQPATTSLAEIRQRILQGHYDTPAMAESVAHRLLQSGDL
jgi:hypothetical protein